MIRRRRRQREIPFSFDSFLDVVANVCGIIIRLILVVWVGARSYNDFMAKPRPAQAIQAEQSARELTDPLQDEAVERPTVVEKEMHASIVDRVEKSRTAHVRVGVDRGPSDPHGALLTSAR